MNNKEIEKVIEKIENIRVVNTEHLVILQKAISYLQELSRLREENERLDKKVDVLEDERQMHLQKISNWIQAGKEATTQIKSLKAENEKLKSEVKLQTDGWWQQHLIAENLKTAILQFKFPEKIKLLEGAYNVAIKARNDAIDECEEAFKPVRELVEGEK